MGSWITKDGTCVASEVFGANGGSSHRPLDILVDQSKTVGTPSFPDLFFRFESLIVLGSFGSLGFNNARVTAGIGVVSFVTFRWEGQILWQIPRAPFVFFIYMDANGRLTQNDGS